MRPRLDCSWLNLVITDGLPGWGSQVAADGRKAARGQCCGAAVALCTVRARVLFYVFVTCTARLAAYRMLPCVGHSAGQLAGLVQLQLPAPPGPPAPTQRRTDGSPACPPPPPAQAANEFWLRFEIDHCQLSKLPHRRRRHTRLPSGREACVHVHKLNRPVSGKGRRQHGIWKLLRRAATIVCSGKVQVSAWTVL